MKTLFIKYQPFVYGFLLAIIAISGALWYSIHHDIFIILPYKNTYQQAASSSTTAKKQVDIYIWKQEEEQKERIEIIWESDIENQVHAIVQAWLTLLEQENIISEKITVQDVCGGLVKDAFFISFTASPLPKDASTKTKLKIIDSLVKTVKNNLSLHAPIQLLVQHKPIIDPHIDFSANLPIEGYCATKQTNKQPSARIHSKQYHPLTILIDPVGDARSAGRTIQDTFERGITLTFAQALKEKLESQNSQLRVILSRFPGESIEPLQTAAFANRLDADLYCSFSFYQQKTPVISIDPYFFVYQPVTDFWLRPPGPQELVPYSKAYLCSLQKTAVFASNFAYQLAHHDKAAHYIVHEACGAPVTALMGIKTIALYTEIGISSKEDWVHCVEPIGSAILSLVESKRNEE
jgi:N-acetylmuramoyl-L-alanine amidase